MSSNADIFREFLIVFTDLDGTLLDHESYSFDPAQQALEALGHARVPLVLASSKTAAEMADLARALPHPPAALIVENGAGVIWPGTTAPSTSRHAELLDALNSLPRALRQRFSGFSDWGPEEISRQTGLAPAQARLAAQREFSEPGHWSGSAAKKAEFLASAARLGVDARQGGRFLTLSFGADKADRMREVSARLAPRAHVLALGDAPNDAAMLEAADSGIIIANPHGIGIDRLTGESSGRIRRSTRPGPAGWNDAVLDTIERLKASRLQS